MQNPHLEQKQMFKLRNTQLRASKDLIWVVREVGFNKYAAHIATARGANGKQRPRWEKENNFNKEEMAASRSSGEKTEEGMGTVQGCLTLYRRRLSLP